MTQFSYTPPTNVLAKQYIVGYYSAHGKMSALPQHFLSTNYPAGLSYLLFMFEEESAGVITKNNFTVFKPKVYIKVSSQERVDIRLFKQDLSHFVVLLYPHAVYSLFGVAPYEMPKGFDTEADILNVPWIHHLHESLYEVHTHHERIALFEKFLFCHCRCRFSSDMEFWNFLLQRNNFLKLSDIADVLGYSQRHIQKKLHLHTGMTYTTLRSLRQFQLSYQLIMCANKRSKGIDFAKIAKLAHYTDQAHMIRSFHKFAHQTPVNVLKEVNKNTVPNLVYFNGIL